MRRGRLCDYFDRLVDSVVGPLPADTSEGPYAEIWEDGPQADSWQWMGFIGDANHEFGIDYDGAYAKTIDGSYANLVAKVGEAQSVIIDYPCRIYFKVKTNRVAQSGELGSNAIMLDFSSSGEDGPFPDSDLGPALYLRLWFGDGYTFYDETISDTTLQSYDFVVDTWYWVSLDFAPGEHVSLRIWPDLWDDEPEVALIEMLVDDGYFIPLSIDDIKLLFSSQMATNNVGTTIWLNQIGIEEHCTPEDTPPVCGITEGPLNSYTSNEYGYIHYIKPGVSSPIVPTPYSSGGLNYSTLGSGGSPDLVATCVANTVRIITTGIGKITIYVDKYQADYVNVTVYHYEGSTPVSDYSASNISSGHQIAISDDSPNGYHIVDLVGNLNNCGGATPPFKKWTFSGYKFEQDCD